MGSSFLAVMVPVGWLSAWIVGSIIYRQKSGKPLFPGAPDNAVFAEAWRSGCSLKNVLTRLGGARNCLLVYVADGSLTIVPVFPFNLMFLPEIYGLEATAPISQTSATYVRGLLGKRIRLTIKSNKKENFDLWLSDPRAFLQALEGNGKPPNPIGEPSKRPRPGRRLNTFRAFAAIWGVLALAGGLSGLDSDIRFRSSGAITTGTFVEGAGEVDARNDKGVVQYEAGGRSYTMTSLRGAGLFKIGEVERVRYMPDNPASAREDGYLSFDLLFACLGCFMLMLALAIGRIARAFIRSLNV